MISLYFTSVYLFYYQITYRLYRFHRNGCATLRNDEEHSKSGIHYFLYFLTLKNSYIDVSKEKKKKEEKSQFT